MRTLKTVEKLTPEDLRAFPVWEYTNADEEVDETVIRPIAKTPVKTLTGRVVGSQVKLAGGALQWALLGNIDASNPTLTKHFVTLSLFHDGRWFTMARYHDLDADTHGPDALAAFLGLPVDSVFPIAYDISALCIGDAAALIGTIPRKPTERLTRSQIIALAVP
jgi:hypothetical protein